ncbi:DNA-directed RNA polymerase III subunit rpc8 [Fulvia fulva]|uniref:DNA-directed RNA polymerase subunit n=1 Tax=Passalora fulva TaxID=5499 RepID=A0A9Q8L838_PASFU|nr:DNA-directed RNA polymerase III subunit rpc8 [Fulvia fulva]KAK4634217.1 DNA-directed RNA polymerase III subunit rpc8 [Fulvia fulva]KAK4638619.1 DNA-directed RNA polymerase III subunit rpc8 [Fulvia fulva]UJO12535.1 DNA-directed RNA polymerase III subunit rpc8 [Fulvia fulva]WPV08222.1 DNA-directed RNA polymerase III subunit rpc8 [Fulvia fulva]WPV23571.1 DNA-directed RNA polymerase III subunit rpc8 [Fulvia fulva]
MYTLVTLADVVQIQPTDFSKPSMRSIEDFINAKYADKVIHKVGLCVGLHSLISASEGLIGHGTGIVNVNVDFRLIVFRPFRGEIIRATITKADISGITLSADFFEDIHVPLGFMFEDTDWRQDDSGTWAYIWRTDDGEGGSNEFYFDIAETCMVRVEEEMWTDVSPDALRSQTYANDEEEENARRMAPYLIRGSMMHAGLGPTLWWAGEEAAAGEDTAMNGT